MSKSARYHARRRTELLVRLGESCNACFTPDAKVEVHHRNHDGGEYRARLGNAGEVTRLLSLPLDALYAQVELLCPPCHQEAA